MVGMDPVYIYFIFINSQLIGTDRKFCTQAYHVFMKPKREKK